MQSDKFVNFFSRILPEVTAEAHCDIPCSIYEPTPAKIAAMTVLRMVLQIQELRPPQGFPGPRCAVRGPKGG